jgi:hypothetical protein
VPRIVVENDLALKSRANARKAQLQHTDSGHLGSLPATLKSQFCTFIRSLHGYSTYLLTPSTVTRRITDLTSCRVLD